MARVLLVEDNAPNLELMAYLLETLGHTVLAARDGAEGVEVAQREIPDVIVCDIHLPKASGYEVALRLKGQPRLRTIPLIAVTALAMVGDRDKVLAAGFDGYIPKPIAPETFVGQVEAFLGPTQRPSKAEVSTATEAAVPVTVPVAVRARILVVDDSPVNLSLMTSMLEPFGYQVVVCRSVAEALAAAQSGCPDMIISDLHMPNRDGFEFIKLAKADPTLQAVPFVFLSSTVWEAEDKRAGLALGAVTFIQRPVEPQDLLRQIEACLRHVPTAVAAPAATPARDRRT